MQRGINNVRNISVKEKSLMQKIIHCVTAMGVFVNPIAAAAQSITAGADFTHINVNGSVTDITTDKVYGSTTKIGVNVFDTFQLDANHIANMYFGTKAVNSAAKTANSIPP